MMSMLAGPRARSRQYMAVERTVFLRRLNRGGIDGAVAAVRGLKFLHSKWRRWNRWGPEPPLPPDTSAGACSALTGELPRAADTSAPHAS